MPTLTVAKCGGLDKKIKTNGSRKLEAENNKFEKVNKSASNYLEFVILINICVRTIKCFDVWFETCGPTCYRFGRSILLLTLNVNFKLKFAIKRQLLRRLALLKQNNCYKKYAKFSKYVCKIHRRYSYYNK